MEASDDVPGKLHELTVPVVVVNLNTEIKTGAPSIQQCCSIYIGPVHRPQLFGPDRSFFGLAQSIEADVIL